jgi:hypothetical protein
MTCYHYHFRRFLYGYWMNYLETTGWSIFIHKKAVLPFLSDAKYMRLKKGFTGLPQLFEKLMRMKRISKYPA